MELVKLAADLLRRGRGRFRSAPPGPASLALARVDPITPVVRDQMFEICRAVREREDFGPPSFARYLYLQLHRGDEGARIRDEVLEAVRQAMPQSVREAPKFNAAVERAWCAAAGANFFSFQRNALRHHSRTMSQLMWKQSIFVQYWHASFSPMLLEIDQFDARWAENPRLTLLACILQDRPRSLGPDCFRDLKATWRAAGGSDGEFRWVSRQSQSWLGRAISIGRRLEWDLKLRGDAHGPPRLLALLIDAARLRLRYAQFANAQLVGLLRGAYAQERCGVDNPEIPWLHAILRATLTRAVTAHRGNWRRFNPLAMEPALQHHPEAIQGALGSLMDYLRSVEEPESRQRLLRGATLASLLRQSLVWHHRPNGDRPPTEDWPLLELQFPRPQLVTHASRYGESTWLESGADLVKEGFVMRHCVADYARRCAEGRYLVYRLVGTGADTFRATLGVARGDEGWVIDQVQGPSNSFPGNRAVETARALVRQINRPGAGENESTFGAAKSVAAQAPGS